MVVGEILEVMPHPNADRLVLCRLNDGVQEHMVLTGAPNLFSYKGKGELEESLKVAYAREGAQLYDGHKEGWELMTIKRAKIRGVESYSMACSEKELGISEDHEGIILLDHDAPTGTPLMDYMGDAVLDIAITPNIARVANIFGVAREISALTGETLKAPDYDVPWTGKSIEGRVKLEITEPELNPRFVLGLIEGVHIHPSPYKIQRRLTLAGVRPINNIVDATNYAMLEIGEPLHAFDYDALRQRADGEVPLILSRLAKSGEKLETLDGVERELDDFTILVSDSVSALSIGGVIGGVETEVSEKTTNVLLEGAAWNYINIRRTIASQEISSEAAYRFSRGVHPAMAERGVRSGLKLMLETAGGQIAKGLVDVYPLPAVEPTVEISPSDVHRWLGIELELDAMAEILRRLEFDVELEGEILRATAPDHRLDIGEGEVGKADLMEEIARIYGYDRIPETQISDTIPPQYGNKDLEREERVRDLLVNVGLQEVITYRLTAQDQENKRFPTEATPDDHEYIEITNPIVSDRNVMRHSVLASVLETLERNIRIRDRLALFEIGPVYRTSEGNGLPEEPLLLSIALTGMRELLTWEGRGDAAYNFFDLKGILEGLLDGLSLPSRKYVSYDHPTFHPGKCSRVYVGEQVIGVVGELHPMVKERYDLLDAPVLAAELNLADILNHIPETISIDPIPRTPPVLEDLAFVVDEEVKAEEVEKYIRQAGGALLSEVRLFDVYRGEQIEAERKSMAYALTYQAHDRTLTDEEVAKVRMKIIDRLATEIGAKLRA
jgi:phenylalanyl-tRNA synthetase beta chain